MYGTDNILLVITSIVLMYVPYGSPFGSTSRDYSTYSRVQYVIINTGHTFLSSFSYRQLSEAQSEEK